MPRQFCIECRRERTPQEEKSGCHPEGFYGHRWGPEERTPEDEREAICRFGDVLRESLMSTTDPILDPTGARTAFYAAGVIRGFVERIRNGDHLK